MDTVSKGGVSVKRGSAGGAGSSPARRTLRGLFLATWQGWRHGHVKGFESQTKRLLQGVSCLEDSSPVVLRLCSVFRHMENRGLDHRAMQRNSLVILNPAEVGCPSSAQITTKRMQGPGSRWDFGSAGRDPSVQSTQILPEGRR